MANTPKQKPRVPRGKNLEPRAGFHAELKARQELLCDDLGMTENEADNVWLESRNCKGHSLREQLMFRRVVKRDTIFDDGGYYLEFFEVSSGSRIYLAVVGPFDEREDVDECYNVLIDMFGFSKDLKIGGDADGLFDIESSDDEGLFDIDDDDDDLFGDLDDDEGLFD